MVVEARRAGVTISETVDLLPPKWPLGFIENPQKKRKESVSCSSLGENVSFCCHIWMVESDLGINNMKVQLHPTLWPVQGDGGHVMMWCGFVMPHLWLSSTSCAIVIHPKPFRQHAAIHSLKSGNLWAWTKGNRKPKVAFYMHTIMYAYFIYVQQKCKKTSTWVVSGFACIYSLETNTWSFQSIILMYAI